MQVTPATMLIPPPLIWTKAHIDEFMEGPRRRWI
jgi:hypothetical protein